MMKQEKSFEETSCDRISRKTREFNASKNMMKQERSLEETSCARISGKHSGTITISKNMMKQEKSFEEIYCDRISRKKFGKNHRFQEYETGKEL